MSEQPQELANIHIEHYFPKGYNPDDEPWKSIRAHHNAALAAAKQEGIDWADKQYYGVSGHKRIRELEEQLAAEREKRKLLVEATRHAELALAGVYPAPAALQECHDALAK
jgi:hypothetical protein